MFRESFLTVPTQLKTAPKPQTQCLIASSLCSQVVQTYLYKEQGFQLPLTNLSGVPEHTRVDHPGVWENAKHAYLHEALITKRGIAAVLAVLQADVLQRLMKLGALEFAVRTDCSDFTK